MADDSPVSSSASRRLGVGGLDSTSLAVAGPFLAITGSELALFFGHLDVTLWGHLLTLLACLLVPLRVPSETRTLQAFALVPLFRLVNLGMPTFFDLTLAWFPFIYGALVPALYLVVSGDDRLDPRWGGRVAVTLLPGIAIVAWALAYLEFVVITPEALIAAASPLQLAFLTVVMVGFVGFVEELLFRGVLQRTLSARLGHWTGIVLASVLFGLMHSGYNTALEMVLAAAIGFLFGVAYERTDSLATVTLAHGLLNVVLFGLLPHGIGVVTW